MKATLNAIVEQFDVCASLMSDPVILRKHSQLIADNFVTAMRRIEHLRAYLKKPKSLSSCKPWFDESIIDAGIKRMVGLVLERHMLPLSKTYKFPKIFERELYREGLKENNLTIQEIKETNCAGALVLLYYYLYWHVVLILLNQKNHPCCGCEQEKKDDDDVSDIFTELLDLLPKDNEILDHRRFSSLFKQLRDKVEGNSSISENTVEKVLDSGILAGFLVDSTEFGRPMTHNNPNIVTHRLTSVVHVYRQVMSHVFHKQADKEGGGEEHESNDRETHFKPMSSINALTAACLSKQVDLFGGVFSTFNLQDDITKWADMYKLTEVQSSLPKGRGTAVYSYRLVNVLMNAPFSTPEHFKELARHGVVYDYGLVALMMDVCKSFLALSNLLKVLVKTKDNDKEINDALGLLLTRPFRFDPTPFESVLTDVDFQTARTDDTEFHTAGYIAQTLSWTRAACNIHSLLNIGGEEGPPIMIDNFAGMYWGGRATSWDQYNHQYMAYPSLKYDTEVESGLLARLQQLCIRAPLKNKTLILAASSICRRNSLFVFSLAHSLDKLAEKMACLVCGDILHIHDPNDTTLHDDAVEYHTARYFSNEIVFPDEDSDRLNKIYEKHNNPDQNTNLTEIRKNLKAEIKALQEYVTQIKNKGFQKYPGISWPLYFTKEDGEQQNTFKAFQNVRSVPRSFPPLVESVWKIADAVNFTTGERSDDAVENGTDHSTERPLRPRFYGSGVTGVAPPPAAPGIRSEANFPQGGAKPGQQARPKSAPGSDQRPGGKASGKAERPGTPAGETYVEDFVTDPSSRPPSATK